jgi:hypothetical protein
MSAPTTASSTGSPHAAAATGTGGEKRLPGEADEMRVGAGRGEVASGREDDDAVTTSADTVETEAEKQQRLEDEHIWPELSTTRQVLLTVSMTLCMMLNVRPSSLHVLQAKRN